MKSQGFGYGLAGTKSSQIYQGLSRMIRELQCSAMEGRVRLEDFLAARAGIDSALGFDGSPHELDWGDYANTLNHLVPALDKLEKHRGLKLYWDLVPPSP